MSKRNIALKKLANSLEGTCDTLDRHVEKLDLEKCNFDEGDLLEFNIEPCSGCGWWMESSELVNEDSEVVGCSQCRGKK